MKKVKFYSNNNLEDINKKFSHNKHKECYYLIVNDQIINNNLQELKNIKDILNLNFNINFLDVYSYRIINNCKYIVCCIENTNVNEKAILNLNNLNFEFITKKLFLNNFYDVVSTFTLVDENLKFINLSKNIILLKLDINFKNTFILKEFCFKFNHKIPKRLANILIEDIIKISDNNNFYHINEVIYFETNDFIEKFNFKVYCSTELNKISSYKAFISFNGINRNKVIKEYYFKANLGDVKTFKLKTDEEIKQDKLKEIEKLNKKNKLEIVNKFKYLLDNCNNEDENMNNIKKLIDDYYNLKINDNYNNDNNNH